MATVGSSIVDSSTGIDLRIDTEQVENVSVTTVEVSHALPSGTKVYKISNRGNKLVRIAFTTGTTGTSYWSLWPGSAAETANIKSTASITLFMTTTTGSSIVEIWSGQ